MNSYSVEEIKKFESKDRRISLQGLIQSLIGAGANVNEVKEVCALAKKYQDEIYRIVEGKAEPVSEESIIPMATAAQQKILEYIAIELKIDLDDSLREEVLDWTESNYKKRIYPSKEETGKKFIKWWGKEQ